MPAWEEALSRLVQARGGELKRYGYLLCGDQAEAEDLVQDALVRAFTFTGSADVVRLEAYVRKIMLNLFLDRSRRRALWRRLMPLIATPDHLDAQEPSELHQALRELSSRQRACVVLHYYLDLPVAEIGDQLGISAGGVKRHLHEARGRLAADLSISREESYDH